MSEERVLSELVWTPERGLAINEPEVRGIALDNLLLSGEYGSRRMTETGIRITPDIALQSTVVLACCRILAETIASLPIHVYRRTKDGEKEIARDIPLYKVLSFAPNSWQTKFEFFEQVVMNLCLWGNSYTQIMSGRYGAVSELINLHPSRMEVERLENGRLRYSYTNPETNRLEMFTQDQIMHVRWTPEQDGIKGMVPVEIAREAIALARACEQHAARYWANSARPGVVLQTDGSLSPEAAERLRDNWERLHRGSQNAWRTAVLTNGLKAEPLGFTAEQSQFLDSRKFQCDEIARVFRMPTHLVNGTGGGNLEVQGQEFVTYTLLPWLRRIESAISRALIYNDDVFFAEFDVKGLLRGDSNSRAAYYSTMTNLGILSVNECRRFENLPPLEHGDNHFVAMNMQTLEDAAKPKQDPMAAMMAGGGAPPEATGGVPSLSEVKVGKSPTKAPMGIESKPKPKMEEAVEEKRGFCPTGEGGGIDNSCGSKEKMAPDGVGGGGGGGGARRPQKSLEQQRLEAAGLWEHEDFTDALEAPDDDLGHGGFAPDLMKKVTLPGAGQVPINVDDPEEVSQYVTLLAKQAGMTVEAFTKSKRFNGSHLKLTPEDKVKIFGGNKSQYIDKSKRLGGRGGWGAGEFDELSRGAGSLLRAAGMNPSKVAEAFRKVAKVHGTSSKDEMYDSLRLFRDRPEAFLQLAAKKLDMAEAFDRRKQREGRSLEVPSDDEIRNALGAKGKLVGKYRDLEPGTKVALRIDIPAFENHNVYAVTVHAASRSKSGVGKVIGYGPVVRLDGQVSFMSDERAAQKIADGAHKTPMATVVGGISGDSSIPENLEDWTPVGFNPKKAAFFFDKRTGNEIVGGIDSLSVGNTVYVRVPVYGNRNAQKQYRSCTSWGVEPRAFCATGEGGGIDNSCGAKEKMAPDGAGGGGGGSSKSPDPDNPYGFKKVVAKIAPSDVPDVKIQQMHDDAKFLEARNKSTRPQNFTDIDPERLAASTKFISEDGTAGCLIDPDGDLGNVFNNGSVRNAGTDAVLTAIEHGALTLDCYDDFLPQKYAQVGFVPVAKVRWNDEFAPPNWNYEADGRPDVVIMAYQGGDRSTIRSRVGSFPSYVPLFDQEYSDDFDAAKRLARERATGSSGLPPTSQRGAAGLHRSADREEGPGVRPLSPELAEGPVGLREPSVASEQIVKEASATVGALPLIEFRAVGNSIATYSHETDTIYVNPSLEPVHLEALASSSQGGWMSQPNPVLHEYAHRVHRMSNPGGYDAACEKPLTEDQRSIIAEHVSRYGATNAKEFVAEYIAGRLSGKTYPDDVIEIVRSVTDGSVRL